MTATTHEPVTLEAYGVVSEPATLTLQRLLPGPIERVWAYLTQSDLRKQWLASGDMEMKTGAQFQLTWRNDELTDPPGRRPEGFGEEHSLQSEITELDAPRRLAFGFGGGSEVTFELEPKGNDVLLTLTHRRVPDRGYLLSVSAGWHAHLDLLVARMSGGEALPHWDHWSRLRAENAQRIPE